MVRKTNAAVVDELIPGALSVGELQKVLQNLIREKVSIRDLVTVFETLADHAKSTKDTEVLTEFVRQALARYFTHKYSKDGIIYAITIDSELEQHILESLRQADKYSSAGLDPHVIQGIYNCVINEFKRNAGKEYDPVILCSPLIRGYFRKIVEKILPNLAVLSYNEIVPKVEVRSVGMVKVPL